MMQCTSPRPIIALECTQNSWECCVCLSLLKMPLQYIAIKTGVCAMFEEVLHFDAQCLMCPTFHVHVRQRISRMHTILNAKGGRGSYFGQFPKENILFSLKDPVPNSAFGISSFQQQRRLVSIILVLMYFTHYS